MAKYFSMRPSLFVKYCQFTHSLVVSAQYILTCGFYGFKALKSAQNRPYLSLRNFGEIFLKSALDLRQKCAKVEIQKSKQIVNKPLYSKFQAKILKNVGREAFLVTAN